MTRSSVQLVPAVFEQIVRPPSRTTEKVRSAGPFLSGRFHDTRSAVAAPVAVAAVNVGAVKPSGLPADWP